MVNPVERLTAEWQLAPAAALSDLPYTGMAVMRWTCRTALKTPAGRDNSNGLISASSFKEAGDPTWTNDEGMKKWVAFMDAYYPEGDRKSIFTTYGYSAAELMVQVLRRRRRLARECHAAGGKPQGFQAGSAVARSCDQYQPVRVIKEFRMMRFNGERWEPFGPIVAD
jgi:hypothetical protein